MKEKFLLLLLVVLLACLLLVTLNSTTKAQPEPLKPQTRSVAVTFDDLPAPHLYEVEKLRGLTCKLLATFEAHRIPVIGFVNEGKLEAHGGKEVEARTQVLKI